MLLLFLSIVCDSILPNVQEKLFAAGSSRLVRLPPASSFLSFFLMSALSSFSVSIFGHRPPYAHPPLLSYPHQTKHTTRKKKEVTFYSNIFTLGAMTVSMLFSGDLFGAVGYAQENSQVRVLACFFFFLNCLG